MKLISWSGQGAFVISVVSVLGYRADLLPFRLAFLLYILALLLCVVVVGIGLFHYLPISGERDRCVSTTPCW